MSSVITQVNRIDVEPAKANYSILKKKYLSIWIFDGRVVLLDENSLDKLYSLTRNDNKNWLVRGQGEIKKNILCSWKYCRLLALATSLGNQYT